MDLMRLAAKITLDDDSFKSGIKNAESMGERLQGKISAMTIAVGNLVTDVIRRSVSGIQSIIGGAIDGYADYQQLIGGVETLFKGSADKVSAYAKESFRNTGLSANDYMETVTGFSASLLQGLKGDTDAAAELANTAIQDMADNANKMGTDISSIQTAYQGFAKQNYTMLDNLKLGYGGTREEMVRLVNDSGVLDHEIKDLDGITFDQLIQAIHQIQTEMGITGTTANEAASTISGSKASLAAAWEDLLTAVAGDGNEGLSLEESLENFQTSFSTYMDNYIPKLDNTILNLGELVEGVSEAVANLPTDMISNLTNAGLEAGADMISGAENIVNWLIDSLVLTLNTLTIDPSRVHNFGSALGHFVGSAVGNLLVNFPEIAEGLMTVGITLAGSIIEGIWDGLFGNGTNTELQKIQDELDRTITDAEVQSTKAQSILGYMESLEEKYGAAARETDEWKRAEEELETVLGGSKGVFEEYGEDVQGAIDKLKDMTEELRRLAIQQAMQDKLTAQYKLLGEYEEQRLTAEAEIAYAESEMEAIDKRRAESAKAYAQALMNGRWLEEGSSAWWAAKNTLETPGYAGTGLSELVSAVQDMYEWNRTSEEDKVWNMSQFDDILSPETLNGLDNAYETNRQTIETATDTIESAQESINQTNQAIQITMTAMANMEAELANLGGAANAAAGNLWALSIVKPSGSKSGAGDGKVLPGGITYMPEATGIDDVPYNGFRAELHKGEAVLTKEENDARRRGSAGIEDFEQALEDAIERSMSRMYINMSGEKVADITTRRTGNNISGAEHARMRAIGG